MWRWSEPRRDERVGAVRGEEATRDHSGLGTLRGASALPGVGARPSLTSGAEEIVGNAVAAGATAGAAAGWIAGWRAETWVQLTAVT
jgi:hypothetical protein